MSEFLNLIRQRATNTPDFATIDRNAEKHLVFVYGTLKFGYHNHHLLQGAEYIGTGVTVHKKYSMIDVGFPVVFDDRNAEESKRGSITGEIYAADIYQMAALDRLENNGVMYNREEVSIVCRNQNYGNGGDHTKPIRRCFMYIGDDQYWSQERDYLSPVIMNQKKFISWGNRHV